MKTKRTLLLTTTFVALALLATFGLVRNFQKVEAFNPQPDPPGLGMVGIAQGQTLRINVVNTALPNPDFPPDPCRVTLNFRNADGEIFRNGDGNPITRTILLQAGRSTSLELNADDFQREANGMRLQLRPVARVQQSDGNRNLPPDPCIPTAEVFNNANGRTQFLISYLPAVQRAATPQ